MDENSANLVVVVGLSRHPPAGTSVYVSTVPFGWSIRSLGSKRREVPSAGGYQIVGNTSFSLRQSKLVVDCIHPAIDRTLSSSYMQDCSSETPKAVTWTVYTRATSKAMPNRDEPGRGRSSRCKYFYKTSPT